jgi:DNA-binding PadR family transcriptional regulator
MADKELVVSSQDPEFSPESKRSPKRWYTTTDVGKEYLRVLEDFHSIQEKYRLL